MRFFFFFKQKTAYEMRISDWSSDVCSSDLRRGSATSAGDGGDRRHRVLHAADPASAAGVVSPAASGSIRRANCNVIPRLTINLCENAAAMSAPLADPNHVPETCMPFHSPTRRMLDAIQHLRVPTEIGTGTGRARVCH